MTSPPKHTQIISTITSIQNETPSIVNVIPISEDEAWCSILGSLSLINKNGETLKQLSKCAYISSLFLQPDTGILYGALEDRTICTIDTNTGESTVVMKCPYLPCHLTVKANGDMFVGEYWSAPGHVYKYSSAGKLLHKSKNKYPVYDICYNDKKGHVLIACIDKGVFVLDDTLTNVIHTHKSISYTAVYDNDGSLIIGDRDNVAIQILDCETMATLWTFTSPEMSVPYRIRLCDNSMWVVCNTPNKFVHLMFQQLYSPYM